MMVVMSLNVRVSLFFFLDACFLVLVIFCRLLRQNWLSNKFQLGITRRKFVLAQLLTCYDLWTRAINQKELVTIVHIDLRLVFDDILHVDLFKI